MIGASVRYNRFSIGNPCPSKRLKLSTDQHTVMSFRLRGSWIVGFDESVIAALLSLTTWRGGRCWPPLRRDETLTHRQASGRLSAEEKRQRIDKLLARRNHIVQQAVKRMNRWFE